MRYTLQLSHIQVLLIDTDEQLVMGIHDITFVADSDRRMPSAPEPVEADGTRAGANNELALKYQQIELILPPEELMNQVNSWWTGLWPLLHSRTTDTLDSGVTYTYQMSVDLLCDTFLEDFAVDTPVDDNLTDDQITLMAQTSVLDLFAEAFTVEAAILLGSRKHHRSSFRVMRSPQDCGTLINKHKERG
jgi:hypothetical protein